jgi:hypothetical protein
MASMSEIGLNFQITDNFSGRVRFMDSDIMLCHEAVQKIKAAILQSRYRMAEHANLALLNLYYEVGRYISGNTRSGKWGSGAIEAISKQLQGEIPGLHGFSPSNMKNMRIFFEEWSAIFETNRQLATADLEMSIWRSCRYHKGIPLPILF